MASVAKREWTYKGERKSAWVVRFVDAKGTHRQKTFDRKKEADAYRVQVENEAQQFGRDGVTGDCTVKELLDAYSRHYERRYADKQIKRGTLKNHLNFDATARRLIERKLVSELDLPTIERFCHALRDDEGLSARTAFERLIALCGAWDFAKRQKMARGDNPVSEAMKHIWHIPKAKIKTLSPTDVQTIVTAAETRRRWQHDHAFQITRIAVNVGAFCGLRWGEIFALRLADIDLERRRIHVRHTIDQWDALTSPKTPSSFKVVPMAPHIADLFAAFIANHYQPNDRQIILRSGSPRKGQTDGGRIYLRPSSAASGDRC